MGTQTRRFRGRRLTKSSLPRSVPQCLIVAKRQRARHVRVAEIHLKEHQIHLRDRADHLGGMACSETVGRNRRTATSSEEPPCATLADVISMGSFPAMIMQPHPREELLPPLKGLRYMYRVPRDVPWGTYPIRRTFVAASVTKLAVADWLCT